MRSKKLLSLVLVLCMILPLLPVFATDSAETETNGNITWIINDSFDENLGNWQLGNFTETTGNVVTFKQETLTEDEKSVGVMTLSTTTPTSDVTTSEPFIYNDFDDVNFSDVDKIVIETRVKTTGGYRMNKDVREEGGRAYLRMNRPHEIDLLGDETNYNFIGWAGGALFEATPTSIKYKSNEYGTTDLDEITSGEWVNVRIIIDSSTALKSQKYTMITWADGDVANAVTTVNGILKENKVGMYDPEGWKANDTTEATMHTALRNLTFTLRNYSNTINIDYIRAYEATPVYADAQILGGSTVEAGQNAQLQFINVFSDAEGTTPAKVGSVPADAVTIKNASGTALKTELVYDAENQIISVKPADGGFVKGETYTIALNETALSSIGMNCTGTTSFTVKGRGARSKGLAVNDSFETATDKDKWIIGESTEGYQAVTDIVDVDGEDGNKALKVTMKTNTNAAKGLNQIPNITRNVGNGIEFKDDKDIVVKTRMKLSTAMIDETGTANESKFQLRMNPADYSAQVDYHVEGWMTYGLLKINPSTGVNIVSSIAPHVNNGVPYASEKTISGTSGINDKWVTYTLNLNTSTDTLDVIAEIETVNDGVVTITEKTGTAKLNTTSGAMEKEYGTGTDKTAFDALDTLNFAFWDNANTNSIAYIDYIQVYEEDAFATAAMSKTQYKKGEIPAVVFTTDMEIDSIPEGAVTTEGFEATPSFDSENKTLTLTPNGALKAGTTYTVKVDAKKLEEAGMFYTGAETLKFSYIGTYAVYDKFDTDTTEGWIIGAKDGTTEGFSYGVETVDGVKALTIKNHSTTESDNYTYLPNMYKEFEDVPFVDGQKVIIEARVKQTGDKNIISGATTNNGITYLKYNRPNTTSFASKDLGSNFFALARLNVGGIATWTTDRTSASTTTDTTVDLTNKWVDMKLEIAGKVVGLTNSADLGTGYRNMTATYVVDGKTYGPFTQRLVENAAALTDAGYTASEELTAFPSLSSLTWMTRRYANELYVDEIKVYITFDADAQILGGSTVEAGKTADIQFINFGDNANLDAIPEGAVTINGTAAVQTYNAATQTVSVKPVSGEFAEGQSYTIALDTEVLSTIGMNCTGTTSFTVTGRGTRSKGLVINDDFANGTGEWEVGVSESGYEAKIAAADATTDTNVTGATDGKALKITFPNKASASSTTSVFGNVTKAVGNGIEFSNDKNIILKTRVKNISSETDYQIRVNRPNTLAQLANEEAWLNYYLLRYNKGTSSGISLFKGFGTHVDGFSYPGADAYVYSYNNGVDYTGKWVTYTLELEPSTQTFYTTMTYTNDEGEEIEVLNRRSDGKLLAQSEAYEKEYGKGTFDKTNPPYFKTLDRLTFAGFYAGDIYIDYVQVYEEDAFASVEQINKKVRNGQGIEFKVNTTTELTEAQLEGAVSVDGIETTYSYDAENKIITLMPVENIAEGTVCNITVNKSVFEAAGLLYDGETEFTVKSTGAYIINDQFTSDLGDWRLGDSNYAADENTLTLVTSGEFAGTMKFEKSATSDGTENTPRIINELDTPYVFNEDSKVVLKTRFYHTGGTNKSSAEGGIVNFKFNMPDVDELTADGHNLIGYQWYTMFRADGEAFKYMPTGSTVTSTSDFAQSTVGKWIDVEVMFDGTADKDPENYVLKATIDGTTYTMNGTTKQYKDYAYTAAGYENGVFDSIKTFTWMLRTFSNTLYIDKFELYEVEAYQAYAQMPAGNTVKAGESINLTFYGKDVIDSIPADAVKINDTNAKQIAIADNTLSIKPASGEFVKGNIYTVTIDAKALESVGMNYIGTTTFKVRARDDFQTGLVLDDQFETSVDEWAPGAVADENMEATVEWKDSYEGANGVLHFVGYPVSGTYGYEDMSTVTKLIGEGIEIKENMPITIKTKIMQIGENGRMDIKLNRPDVVPTELEEHSWTWNHYTIMRYQDNDNKLKFSSGASNHSAISNDQAAHYVGLGDFNIKEAANTAQVVDALNKWVVYTITINPGEHDLAIKAEILDENGNVVETHSTHAGNPSTTRTAFGAYENIYGKNPNYTTQEHYADKEKKAIMNEMSKWVSMDRLTFASTSKDAGNEFYIDYITVEQNDESRMGTGAFKVGDKTVTTLNAGDVVTPVYTLSSNAKYSEFNVIAAMYVDGKLDSTYFDIAKSYNSGEFTFTGTKTFTVPNTEKKVEIKAFVWDESLVPLGKTASAVKEETETYTVYVRTAQNGGSDNATGASNAPVASLEKALELVYGTDKDAAKIVVGDGNYKVAETIKIPKGANIPDGGLTIIAENNRKAVFVGGNTYTGDAAVLVDNTDTNYSRIPSGAQGKVYKLALGTDVAPVSYPGEPSYSITNAVKGLGLEDDTTLADVTTDVAFDGELMTIARWPNTGYETTTKVFDSETQSWLKETDKAAYTNIYTAKTDFASKTEDKIAAEKSDALIAKAKTGITFGVNTSKSVSDWSTATDALIFGYWMHDWATQTMPLGTIDTTNNSLTTKYASWYGARTGARYYVFNLLEELDTAGEYYIDRTPDGNDVLYFYSEEAPTADNKITISTNITDPTNTESTDTEPMFKVSTENEKVVIDGLVFENARGTGVALSGAIGATVQNCEMRNLASHGLTMYSKDCVAQNNYIHDTNGGIVVNHNNQQYAEQLTKSNNTVYNNEVENFSRIDKVYCPALLIGGVGNVVKYNKIHDGTHLAVSLSGYNNELIYNEFTNVLQEVDDAGAVYMGRSWSNRGNKVISNYFHDISSNVTGGSPISCVYMDDHYAGVEVSGNVFKNIGGYGVMTNRGREQVITNNLAINCSNYGIAVGGPDYNDGKTVVDFTTQQNSLDKISSYFNNEYWKAAFPELCVYGLSSQTDWAAQQRIIVKNNVAIGGAGNVRVSAYAATYTNPTEYTGSCFEYTGDYDADNDGYLDASYLNSDVSENAGTITPASLGTSSTDTTASKYIAASLTEADYTAIVNNPGAAEAGSFGLTNFKAIEFGSMRK